MQQEYRTEARLQLRESVFWCQGTYLSTAPILRDITACKLCTWALNSMTLRQCGPAGTGTGTGTGNEHGTLSGHPTDNRYGTGPQ